MLVLHDGPAERLSLDLQPVTETRSTLFLSASLKIGEGGRSLEWPGELDFCADALWFEQHPEDAPREPRAATEQGERRLTP